MGSGGRRVVEGAKDLGQAGINMVKSPVEIIKAGIGQGETGNIFKDLGQTTIDSQMDPFIEGSRAIGLEGVSGAIEKGTGYGKAITNMSIDMSTGKYSENKAKMKAEQESMNRQANAARAAGIAKQAEAARQAEDQARIKEGTSKSNTLLTGGMGLEDDENSSVSRRFLTGR